jgi:hypothetical protein
VLAEINFYSIHADVQSSWQYRLRTNPAMIGLHSFKRSELLEREQGTARQPITRAIGDIRPQQKQWQQQSNSKAIALTGGAMRVINPVATQPGFSRKGFLNL